MGRYTFGGGRTGSTHEVILSLVPPSAKRVLDVGCASGYLGRELRRRGPCEVWGIETDPDAADAAEAEGYADVARLDLDRDEDWPWVGLRFDAVIAGDVLEHLVHPEPVLRRIADGLEPGAPLIVSLPNVANVAIRLDLLRGRFDYTDTGILDRTHVRLYTYASARQLMSENGFVIDEELGGSATFGSLINRPSRLFHRLQPSLAHSIVLRGRPIDGSAPDRGLR